LIDIPKEKYMNRKQYMPEILIALIIYVLSFTTSGIVAQETRQQIAQKAFPSVVLLVMEDENGQPVSLGSGFFIRNGVIATNLHVVEEARSGYAKIIGQDTKHDIAGIVGIDSARDLVLLSVEGAKANALLLENNGGVSVGDEIYAIGNPQGLEGTFSQGIISGIRNIGSDTVLQITAPISPGSSGGPVLNTQGKVIGVAVATFKGGQNLNFAIPVSYLSQLLSDAKSVTPLSGKIKYAITNSILNDLGGKSNEGVIGTLFTWSYPALYMPHYSFSLRNKLRQPVKGVYCLLIFYTNDGEPIDFKLVQFNEIIPAGLAKRVSGYTAAGVHELVGNSLRNVEIRVLDFKIED